METRIGVCSWSLNAKSPADLVDRVREVGLEAIQLALDPLGAPPWDMAITRRILREANLTLLSGMLRMKDEDYATPETIRRTGGVRVDANWPANLENAKRCAGIAEELALPLVTLHAGFLPPEKDDPVRGVMIERLRAIVDVFEPMGARIGLETGQETAETMLAVLTDLERPTVGVNFDPANMLLYDHGDPVEALKLLAPHVVQIHIKDAKKPTEAGAWGTETAVGTGEVKWDAFFKVMRDASITCDLVIEREGKSEARVNDIRAARALVLQHIESEK